MNSKKFHQLSTKVQPELVEEIKETLANVENSINEVINNNYVYTLQPKYIRELLKDAGLPVTKYGFVKNKLIVKNNTQPLEIRFKKYYPRGHSSSFSEKQIHAIMLSEKHAEVFHKLAIKVLLQAGYVVIDAGYFRLTVCLENSEYLQNVQYHRMKNIKQFSYTIHKPEQKSKTEEAHKI